MRFPGLRKYVAALLLSASLGCGGSAPGSADSPADGVAASNPSERNALYAIPGTATRMRLPDGFTRPARDARLAHEELGIVASLVELRVAADEVQETMRGVRAGLTEKIEVDSESPVERASGAIGFTVRGRREGLSASAAALSAGETVSILLVIHSPESADVVAGIVGSVDIAPEATFDPLLAHGLSFGEMAGLELVSKTLAPIMFFEKGVKAPVPPDAAVLSIAIVPVPEMDHPNERMAGAALGGLLRAYGPDPDHVEAATLRVDGTEVSEVVTQGSDKGSPVALYGAALIEPHAVLAFFGKVGAKRRDQYVPRFRKLVESMHRSAPPLEVAQPAGG